MIVCTQDMGPSGRIVIPHRTQKAMLLQEGTPVQFSADPGRDTIFLRPMRLQCVCCGRQEEAALRQRNGVLVCLTCIDALVREEGRP